MALQAWIIPTLQHVFQRNSNSAVQAQLHAFSPCCISLNLPQLLWTLSKTLGVGSHREGVRRQSEEWHKAFLLCFCFVTRKDDSACFYAHQATQNSPSPCCNQPANCVILFVDLGLPPQHPIYLLISTQTEFHLPTTRCCNGPL